MGDDSEYKNINKSVNFMVNIPNLFLEIYVLVDFSRFFNFIPLIVGNVTYLLLGSLAIIYSIYKKGIGRQIPIIGFVFLYTFFGVLGVLLNGNINFQEILWPFGFIGVAILLLNFNINYRLIRIIYYFGLLFIIINIIIAGGVDYLEISSSRNTVGIMALIYFAFHAISNYVGNKSINIFPVLIGLITTILAVGRSGILTFLLLVILFLNFEFNGNIQKMRNPLKWLFIICFGGILFWISYNLLGNYFNETMRNFQNRGIESVRIQIWQNYLVKTSKSITYILFGTPIEGSFLLDKYSNNLHNSFLMLHAKYGLIPFLTVIFHIIKSSIYFLKNNNYLYLVLLIAVLFRMQFDYTNFNAQLDIILFYLMFYRYYVKRTNDITIK